MVHNIEAERMLLGAVLMDTEALLKASDIVQAGDFATGAHQCIYAAALDVLQNGGDMDAVGVAERLRQRGELEKAGGISYLIELTREVATTANVRVHAQVVRDKSVVRGFRTWLMERQQAIERGQYGAIEEIFAEAEASVNEMAQRTRESRSPAISEILGEIRRDWMRETTGERTHIPVSMKIKGAVPRMAPGHLWVIGGYTSVGKSTMLAQLLVDAMDEGAKIVVFSLEDSRKDKAIKLMANVADVPQWRLMTGEVGEYAAGIERAEGYLRDKGIVIYDDCYTVDMMRLKAKRHKLRSGLDIVAVDFIQNLSGEGTLYERISDGIVSLQQMARELDITALVVSQVSNEAMRSNSEVIGLKGAGELAAAADVVLWLKRKRGEKNERDLDVEVRKNRPFGKTGLYELMFSSNWTTIIGRGLA